MKYFIGIDLGTSSCKGILVDKVGNIIKSSSVEYGVNTPRENFSEQDPSDWLFAAKKILSELSAGVENDVYGLSFGGQMHGLVALDENDEVIRPCILWNDGRTETETAYLNEKIGKSRLSALTGNIAFAGFTAPKILWLRENEPENYAKIKKIMLPKDYLAYKLTGVFSTDYSDASGMLLLDVEHRCWSEEMCKICGVAPSWLPRLYESYEVTGKLLPEYNMPNCVVTAGAGDNAAAAVGTGCVESGSCNISLGTSGTVFISRDAFSVDEKNALHSFAHANGKYHLMGCILTAASARKWWLEDIIGTSDYAVDEEEIARTETDVIFLPYLVGERSPHNDVNIRGAFIGLSGNTTRAQMSRAVMEGVAFALLDCVRISGVAPKRTMLCGGGARSRVWRQIIADVMNIPVDIPKTEQGPSYGAAMLAMVGSGEYETVEDAAREIVTVSETVTPQNHEKYERKYEIFTRLYPAIKEATK